MRYRIGIFDKDVAYCTRLMEYINMNKEYMSHSIYFSDARMLLESVDKKQIDLVLYGQESDLISMLRDKCQVMRLSDVDEELYVGERYLYKYQRADALVRQVLLCLEIEVEKTVDGVLMYGVYSPIGRCGKTSFALGICRNYPGSLYIGMNSFIGSVDVAEHIFLQAERFFYQLLTRNEAIVHTIQEILQGQGGEYAVVYGMRCFADYKQLTAEDIVWLRKQLVKGDMVARVVFDIGTAVLADLNIMKELDRVYVPSISDAYANRRMHHFRTLLEADAYATLCTKLEYIEIPMESYDSIGMRDFVRRNVK